MPTFPVEQCPIVTRATRLHARPGQMVEIALLSTNHQLTA